MTEHVVHIVDGLAMDEGEADKKPAIPPSSINELQTYLDRAARERMFREADKEVNGDA